jgi:CHAT domain-containing protein
MEGSEATLSAIRDLLSTVEVFHFAGHAFPSPVQGLALGSGNPSTGTDLLSAELLESQNLEKMQLAVLSACGTSGTEPDATGTPDSLEFAFLQGGVPRIVGSRWSVDSVSTTALMSGFYDSLISGKDVPSAMRLAQIELRGHRQWSHPYFWASFRVLETV